MVNAVLRPIIKTVGCGLYVLTLGLIALVVNGLLFLLTSWIAGQFDLPFHVDGFWPSAVLGALLVGIVSWLLEHAGPRRRRRRLIPPAAENPASSLHEQPRGAAVRRESAGCHGTIGPPERD